MEMVQEIKDNRTLQDHGVSIYIHIPFCERKCNYCDFLSAPKGIEIQKQYVQALLKEMEYWGKMFQNVPIKTVYFGGGTPSILPKDLLVSILCKLKTEFSSQYMNEISIEVNPGTVTKEKLLAYKNAGINRLSIGLQSADNKELKLLGRIHTYETFLETYHMAREVGFDNINVDLISALPGQQIKAWQDTLEKVIQLQPEHISAYSLIIEEGTPFFDTYHEKEELLPDEETDRRMYALTKSMLAQAGYERYEISNYSKKGRECLHNMVYWKREPYIGLGLGSSSMVENIRFQNTRKLESYVNYWSGEGKADENRPKECNILEMEREQNDSKKIKFPKSCENITKLTRSEQMEEFMFLGLRMIKGISVAEFESLFGKDIFQVYGKQIESFQKQKLLTVSDRIALTDEGIDVSNMILAEFLLS